MSLEEQFIRARLAGVPLLGVESLDNDACVEKLIDAIKEDSSSRSEEEPPLIRWDAVDGLAVYNDSGSEAVERLMRSGKQQQEPAKFTNPAAALSLCRRLPENSVLFMFNAHRYVENPGFAQMISTVRNKFKEDTRTLVLLGPDFGNLPLEIRNDVIILDDPLPSEDELRKLAEGCFEEAELNIKEKTLEKVISTVRGLSKFPAEQVISMSMTRKGIDLDALRERKYRAIEQTNGLNVDRTPFTFSSIGGQKQIKEFSTGVFESQYWAPAMVVRVDEIEKMVAGATGVSTDGGVGADNLATMLKEMEDNEWDGIIAVGPAGSGKTIFTKALSKNFGVFGTSMDSGAMKSKMLGESEKNVRAAMKVIRSIAGKRAFFVATCNKLDVIPPELLRRFTMGIWYFDLPDDDEREAIFDIQIKNYTSLGLTKEQCKSIPDMIGWTGAEIRNMVKIAWMRGTSLRDAANYIAPISKADEEGLERLRKMAAGKFLSASYSGTYKREASIAKIGGSRRNLLNQN